MRVEPIDPLQKMSKSEVHILGPNKLQNALMASYLESETGLPCFHSKDMNLSFAPSGGERCVVLWDCTGSAVDNLLTQLDTKFESGCAGIFPGLFNATLDRKTYKVHRAAVLRGIRGIFFEDDPPEVFAKGVSTILKGEHWLSRDFLNKCVLEKMDVINPSQEIRPRLTAREKELLLLLASGASNEEIAQKLCISYHTVKTHLNNIYKKIQAENRLQAAFWASRNL
jgi:DNA-binding CsgD family transcriptional regulator